LFAVSRYADINQKFFLIPTLNGNIARNIWFVTNSVNLETKKPNDMIRPKVFSFILFFTFLITQGCSSNKEKINDDLGEIDLIVSGNEAAQPAFKKGMLLLYSFEYDDAAEEFRNAINIDKDFAMAYWGEAMTHNHPLWRYQNLEKAMAILNELAPTAEEREAKTKTDLEKDLFKSIHILYGKGSKITRDSSFAEFMGTLYKKYPKNNEIASMYSLALIGSVPVGRNTAVYEHAAEIAKEVLKNNPKHPGALHYLIHAYDDLYMQQWLKQRLMNMQL
jgi:tetratricopeptide (TPR) repeat protein